MTGTVVKVQWELSEHVEVQWVSDDPDHIRMKIMDEVWDTVEVGVFEQLVNQLQLYRQIHEKES